MEAYGEAFQVVCSGRHDASHFQSALEKRSDSPNVFSKVIFGLVYLN